MSDGFVRTDELIRPMTDTPDAPSSFMQASDLIGESDRPVTDDSEAPDAMAEPFGLANQWGSVGDGLLADSDRAFDDGPDAPSMAPDAFSMPNQMMGNDNTLLADSDRAFDGGPDGPEIMSQIDSSMSKAIELIDNVAMESISQNQMTNHNQESLDTDIADELDVNTARPTDTFET